MSILAVESDAGGFVLLMLGWTAVALAGAMAFALRELQVRRRAVLAGGPAVDAVPLEYGREPRSPLPIFAAATVFGFGAWLLAQMLFAAVAPPRPGADGGTPTWRPIELAVLMLLAGVCGWGAGFAVLVRARVAADAGYTTRRLRNSLTQAVLGIVVAIPIVYWTLQLTLYTWQKLNIHHAEKHPLLQSMDEQRDAPVIALAAMAAVIAAPLFEELIFRGLIQNGVARATRRGWVGILVASVLFALIHPWWTIPPIFVLSVLLGIVYHRTQNLWAATLMHALFNAFAMATSPVG